MLCGQHGSRATCDSSELLGFRSEIITLDLSPIQPADSYSVNYSATPKRASAALAASCSSSDRVARVAAMDFLEGIRSPPAR